MKMYVIFVTTGRELKIYRELKKRGFNVFMPQENFTGKSGKTFRKVVFPNYLFLKCNLTSDVYGEICRIRNVKYFLGFHAGGVPFLSRKEQRYIEKWRKT